MNSAVAADACPGVLRLHEAADGLLARVRLPGGAIAAGGLRGVAQVAALGNGVVELTARTSLQVRGLHARDSARCAQLLSAAGLLPSESHERVRNILASPLAGRHPHSLRDTDVVVGELDRLICAEPRLALLSGRFLIAVDDGSGLARDSRAHLTLSAVSSSEFRLDGPHGALAERLGPDEAPQRVVDAALDLVAAGAPEGAAAAAAAPATPEPHRGPALGTLIQRDGRRALTVLPLLGRLSREQLGGLAELSEGRGPSVRLSRDRTLTLVDLEPGEPGEFRGRLGGLGFVLEEDSGWRGLSACAGWGACARALSDVRIVAERRASERGPADPPEHFSACERRCGHPARPHVAWTADGGGALRRTLEAGG